MGLAVRAKGLARLESRLAMLEPMARELMGEAKALQVNTAALAGLLQEIYEEEALDPRERPQALKTL